MEQKIFLCDVENVSQRIHKLTYVFQEIGTVTKGMVTIDKLIKSSSLVEIGCGRGAFGQLLRNQGSKNQIIGVDTVYPYEGQTTYDAYNTIIKKDITTEPQGLEKIRSYKPDCVISIGVPLDVNRFMADNRFSFGIPKNGLMVLITDFNIGKTEGFKTFSGTMSINEHIHVFKNT